MAYIFGDGFDLYAAPADAFSGYWDGGVNSGQTLVAGRFAGSQAWNVPNNVGSINKNSSVTTDPVHHIVVAVRQTAALSGTTLGLYCQLSDAATNQVCIVFRSDGAILLTSATPAGTVLATYTGAITAANSWFAFEFEVIINNTTGRFQARKNGNTVADFDSGAVLNTRPGANTQANKLTLAMWTTLAGWQVDDLFWRSDASSVAWMGDIRCYTRLPSTTASAQFAVSPNPVTMVFPTVSSISDATGTSRYSPLNPVYTGTVGSIIVNVNTGFTGNMKCSIFADNAGNPGTVLGSATNVVNPVTGANTFTFGTPVAVTKGVPYWFGISHDVTAIVSTSTGNTGRSSSTVSYAAFPAANPTIVSGVSGSSGVVNITPTNNADFVSEAQQDGATSYVFDSTPGDADFYSIASIAGTPVSTVAVTTRGFMAKSDAGARTGTVQLKSGATTVAAPTATLGTSFGWVWRTDWTDPNTSAAWTAAGVNAVNIGPTTIA